MLGIPKDPEGQKRFFIGVLPFLVVFAYYYFLHGKKAAEVTALETEYETITISNDAARAKASPQAIQALQQKLALFENHIKRLEALIPAREQVPQLLDDFTKRARDSGVDLALLRPQGEEPGQYYTQQNYDIQVIGTYHAVGRFLAQVGSLPRIVTPSDLRLIRVPNPTSPNRQGAERLRADFKIQTYVIPPPPDTTRRPPAPAGAPAPAVGNARM